jgi:hypothetical protein
MNTDEHRATQPMRVNEGTCGEELKHTGTLTTPA